VGIGLYFLKLVLIEQRIAGVGVYVNLTDSPQPAVMTEGKNKCKRILGAVEKSFAVEDLQGEDDADDGGYQTTEGC
jgi:hypothetical protein